MPLLTSLLSFTCACGAIVMTLALMPRVSATEPVTPFHEADDDKAMVHAFACDLFIEECVQTSCTGLANYLDQPEVKHLKDCDNWRCLVRCAKNSGVLGCLGLWQDTCEEAIGGVRRKLMEPHMNSERAC